MPRTGRPVERWYFTTADVTDICTVKSLDSYLRSGDLEANNLLSLLVFIARHLTQEHRQRLQGDVASPSGLTGCKSLTRRKASLPVVNEPGDDVRVYWTMDSRLLIEAIGTNQNIIWTARSKNQLDCGRLLSVLRFALFKAVPIKRAELHQALFQVPVPEPAKKVTK